MLFSQPQGKPVSTQRVSTYSRIEKFICWVVWAHSLIQCCDYVVYAAGRYALGLQDAGGLFPLLKSMLYILLLDICRHMG